MKHKGFTFEQKYLDIIENYKKFYIQMPTYQLSFSSSNDMIRKILDYLIQTNQLKKYDTSN